MKADKDISGEIHAIICENVLKRAYDAFKFEDTFKKIIMLNKVPKNAEEFREICKIQSQSELN